MMARRRRGQFPKPIQDRGQWKLKYWSYESEPDGSIGRHKRTKVLGSVNEITLTEARKEAGRFLEPINDVVEGSEHKQKTMADLISAWTESIKPTLKLSTQLSYEWAFKRIQPAFKGAPLSAIGKADVQAFLTGSSKQLAGESVRDLRGRLSGLFTCAEEWGWIKTGANPAKGRLRLPPRDHVRAKRVIWPEEFHRLISILEQPYTTLVILAVLGGLRRGELAALRWRDNQKPGTLAIDEAVYRGKLGSPKTPKSRREVSIGPLAQGALDRVEETSDVHRGG